jgi:hypothetical protein
MRSLLLIVCALLAICPPLASAAQGEKRVALVIGNSAYQATSELKNPRNDATDMAAALRRLGFEVLEGKDLDKRAMERLIRKFGLKLSGADLALFFYAGHGMQVGGQNYLIPTDARLASEGDADFEALQLSLVLKQMEREAKTSIILLDACRDNPLARNLARTMGTRSAQVGQGLAEVRTGIGTLIGFSTQPGNVASDGTARNSPYAEALLRHIDAPGKDVSGVLIAVRNDVLKATEGRQVPWEHTSLTGQVFLRVDRPPAKLPPGANVHDYEKEMEISFWNSVKDSKSPAVVETYLQRYPRGAFAGLARVMIEQMKQSPRAAPPGAILPPANAENPDLARLVQVELKRLGCNPGPVDGKWGGRARSALEQFTRRAKVSLPSDEPTQAALDALKGQRDRVCPLVCGAGKIEVQGRCVTRAAPAGRPARAKADAPDRRTPRREEKTGMCWALDGRVNIIVPCSDSRAREKAY